jgi:hypothetical protein
MSMFVGTSDIALTRAILHHESLFVGTSCWFQSNALATLDNICTDLPFISPVNRGDKHFDCFDYIPFSSAEVAENECIWVVAEHVSPEAILETIGLILADVEKELIGFVWHTFPYFLVATKPEKMNPCLLKAAFLFCGEIANSIGLS